MRPLRALCFAATFNALLGPALADDGRPATLGGAIGKFFEGANLRSPQPPAADFVVRSRPAELDYAPLAPPPEPPKTKNASQLQKLEKELSAAAAANRNRASRVKLPDGAASKQRSPAEARGSATRQKQTAVD